MSASTPLVFHVVLRVKPERVDEWLREVAALAEAMSKEDTFLSCDLHRDANDPNVFTLYERWAAPDVENFLAPHDNPYRRACENKPPALTPRLPAPPLLAAVPRWAPPARPVLRCP